MAKVSKNTLTQERTSGADNISRRDAESTEITKGTTNEFSASSAPLRETETATPRETEIITPEQARAKQRDNSRRYLGSVSRNSWQTWEAWDTAIAGRLAELDTAKPLTAGQIGAAYKQIGLGLQ
jgi:hypothetical protein